MWPITFFDHFCSVANHFFRSLLQCGQSLFSLTFAVWPITFFDFGGVCGGDSASGIRPSPNKDPFSPREFLEPCAQRCLRHQFSTLGTEKQHSWQQHGQLPSSHLSQLVALSSSHLHLGQCHKFTWSRLAKHTCDSGLWMESGVRTRSGGLGFSCSPSVKQIASGRFFLMAIIRLFTQRFGMGLPRVPLQLSVLDFSVFFPLIWRILRCVWRQCSSHQTNRLGNRRCGNWSVYTVRSHLKCVDNALRWHAHGGRLRQSLPLPIVHCSCSVNVEIPIVCGSANLLVAVAGHRYDPASADRNIAIAVQLSGPSRTLWILLPPGILRHRTWGRALPTRTARNPHLALRSFTKEGWICCQRTNCLERQPTRHARDHSTTKWCTSFWSWPPRRWHLQHHTTLAHETKRHASAQAEASSITGMIVNSHQQPFHDGQNIHPHNWEAWTESSTSRFQKTLPSTTNVASELLHKHHMFLKSQNTFHLRTSALCWSFFSRITLKARCTLKPRDSRTKWSRPVHDPRSSRERKSTCCTSWWGTPVENHTVLFQCWPLSRWRWTWSLRKRGESRHTSNRGTPQWQCAVRCQQQMHLGA